MARISPVRTCAVLVAGLVGAGVLAAVPSASAHEGDGEHAPVLLFTAARPGHGTTPRSPTGRRT